MWNIIKILGIKGWISPIDPYGWLGRRTSDDE